MTTVYLNGGAPNYTGFEFTTTTALLNQIKTTLVTDAGWTLVADEIVSNSRLLVRGEDSGNYCWIEFTVTDNSSITDGKFLSVRGDSDGTNTTKSPDNLKLNFIENAPNYLWITTDLAGGCIATRPFSWESKGIHFGYLNRILSSDTTAWYVGYINCSYLNTYAYKDYHANRTWYQIGDSFVNATHTTSGITLASVEAPIVGFIDRYTVCTQSYSNLGAYTNANRMATGFIRGQVNGVNNLPILGDYFYIEGLTNSTVTVAVTDLPPKLYFRGSVRYAVVGMASLAASSQAVFGDGSRYLSVGDPAADTTSHTWQGMKIKGAA